MKKSKSLIIISFFSFVLALCFCTNISSAKKTNDRKIAHVKHIKAPKKKKTGTLSLIGSFPENFFNSVSVYVLDDNSKEFKIVLNKDNFYSADKSLPAGQYVIKSVSVDGDLLNEFPLVWDLYNFNLKNGMSITCNISLMNESNTDFGGEVLPGGIGLELDEKEQTEIAKINKGNEKNEESIEPSEDTSEQNASTTTEDTSIISSDVETEHQTNNSIIKKKSSKNNILRNFLFSTILLFLIGFLYLIYKFFKDR